MANYRTTDPICISIVIAFLEFLSHVFCEPGEQADLLEDLKYILKELFQINDTAYEATSNFSFFDFIEKEEPSSSTSPSSTDHAIKITDLPLALLFHEFHQALSKSGFFESVFGKDYIARRKRVKNLFKDALELLKESGRAFNYENLVEGLRSLGMKAMDEKYYYNAIEYYTCAIAMCKTNSECFFNRAAAFINVRRIHDAVADYHNATKANPSNIKAYLCLGALYNEQGNYLAAICEGFIKVLQLEPNNQVALDHLLPADLKLKEQLDWKDEQLELLKNHGVIPMSSSYRKSNALVLRSPEDDDGAGDASSSRPWELVEEVASATDKDGRAADFVDIFGLPFPKDT